MMSKSNEKKVAVFMDRDGTINEEVGYLSRINQLAFIPEAPEAIRLINASGLLAVVITNQSGIARGYFDESFVESVHTRMNALLAKAGAQIDRFYYCPHHPTEGEAPYQKACDCRKPAPGLLRQAADDLDIDLSRSYLIGDTAKDLEAARSVGAKGILVRTGYGSEVESSDAAYTADHLLDAVKWVLRDLCL